MATLAEGGRTTDMKKVLELFNELMVAAKGEVRRLAPDGARFAANKCRLRVLRGCLPARTACGTLASAKSSSAHQGCLPKLAVAIGDDEPRADRVQRGCAHFVHDCMQPDMAIRAVFLCCVALAP
eukprot:scaffold58_cov28-Tisochrysis_lutea.AAC.3